MRRCILLLFIIFTAIIGTNAQKAEELSPFVGRWNWSENIDGVQHFYLSIGERNDSILISIGGTFYCGLKIHGPAFGFNDEGYIADVRIKKKNKK